MPRSPNRAYLASCLQHFAPIPLRGTSDTLENVIRNSDLLKFKDNKIEMKKQEKEYYEIIKAKIEELLKTKSNNFHLEVTADKKFSNKLKAEINRNRDIIFRFLREAPPDVAGFIKGRYSSDFVVLEIKKDTIKLDYIYQTKKYADLFNSKIAFLISLKPIPEEIKRLHRVTHELLSFSSYHRTFVLVHFDDKINEFVEWYPENPFEKDWYWE